MKQGGKFSLRTRITAIMLVCWFVPFLLIGGVTGYYLFSNHFDHRISKQMEQLAYNSRICEERLNNIVIASKQASYDGEINELYRLYQSDLMERNVLLNKTSAYMERKYRHDEGIRGAILWYYDEPGDLNRDVYNESAGGRYQELRDYWNQDHNAVLQLAKKLDTSIGFYAEQNRTYIVRNLVDSSFNPVAALVIRINPDYCFGSLSGFCESGAVTIRLNDSKICLTGKEVKEVQVRLKNSEADYGYRIEGNRIWMLQKIKAPNYELKVLIRQEDISIYTPVYGYQYILIGMLIFLFPLLFIMYRLTKKHITEPVEIMMAGAARIEQGNLGYQVGYQAGSVEFDYLTESFNHMSERLKYQFDHIYEEELALRDARIMALQSHINPHFMNNTLEIINWEARLSGNEKVSRMIEALAVLMDATIDRKRQPEVTLREEMKYVDAYLYIISERLGDRIRIYREIPEEIMDYMVPRLILQPVIENAVEHGAVKWKEGTITLRGYLDDTNLYMEIINEGKLSFENLEKINQLLSDDYDACREPAANLGIANVNQRLRILYGDECGLSIKQTDETHVTACLTIRALKDNKMIQEITD